MYETVWRLLDTYLGTCRKSLMLGMDTVVFKWIKRKRSACSSVFFLFFCGHKKVCVACCCSEQPEDFSGVFVATRTVFLRFV